METYEPAKIEQTAAFLFNTDEYAVGFYVDMAKIPNKPRIKAGCDQRQHLSAAKNRKLCGAAFA